METLGLFFRKACYHQNASYRKMKRRKVVENLEIYKFGSVHFWQILHSKKLQNLEKRSEVSMSSKVRGFYGAFACTVNSFLAQKVKNV
jgi:hypothetical protein